MLGGRGSSRDGTRGLGGPNGVGGAKARAETDLLRPMRLGGFDSSAGHLTALRSGRGGGYGIVRRGRSGDGGWRCEKGGCTQETFIAYISRSLRRGRDDASCRPLAQLLCTFPKRKNHFSLSAICGWPRFMMNKKIRLPI